MLYFKFALFRFFKPSKTKRSDKMIKIKNINLILLLSLLNNNLNSMQPSDVKEKESESIAQYLDPMEISDTEESKKTELSNLPEEIIQLIIHKIIEPHIEKIKNIDNIFELYSIEKKNIKKGLKKRTN